MESWHTFAGASDATLSNKGHARRAQLINGTQYFDLGEEWGAPWTFDLPEPSGDGMFFPLNLIDEIIFCYMYCTVLCP